jgi:hypothetical protein
MKRKIALFYYVNQYLFRFIKGKYDIDRTLMEVGWEIHIYNKKVKP